MILNTKRIAIYSQTSGAEIAAEDKNADDFVNEGSKESLESKKTKEPGERASGAKGSNSARSMKDAREAKVAGYNQIGDKEENITARGSKGPKEAKSSKSHTVIDEGGGAGELLTGFMFIDCNIIDNMEMMNHPIENGAVITDYMVRNPVEIKLQVSLNTGDQSAAVAAYSELKQLYLDGAPVMIKTSSDVYKNMLLSHIPYDELPENSNRVVFNLTFKEVLLVEPKYVPLPANKVRKPSDASTVSSGQKQPEKSASDKQSIIIKYGKYAVLGPTLLLSSFLRQGDEPGPSDFQQGSE